MFICQKLSDLGCYLISCIRYPVNSETLLEGPNEIAQTITNLMAYYRYGPRLSQIVAAANHKTV